MKRNEREGWGAHAAEDVGNVVIMGGLPATHKLTFTLFNHFLPLKLQKI